MLQGINIEEIKQYNASLKEQREKAATLKAQIDYTTNELSKLCQELSAELGKEVTQSNIEQIYTEEVNKINSTLQSGKAVLAKIASEGQPNAIQPTQPMQQAQPTQQVQNVAPQMQVQQPTAPVAPVLNAVPQSGIGSAPVAGTVFGNNNAQGQTQTLPPLFNLQ